ncbi:FAD-binding oxidoreductase [Blastococcus sp. KM273128]|uniref:FAD-binding oxidoreductase n=1 Tax=Blastococcus sp. KM273128 TaxID=2570314 RepID=UPI001F1A1CDD|nr:FAD-binding oxidoreductase [Blastococcus sp. KM273128]
MGLGRARLRGIPEPAVARPSPAPALWEDPLAARVAGPVLRPGDGDAFRAECAAVGVDPGHEPAVVVGATGAADVVAAVAHATEHGLPVAVLATGHAAPPGTAGAVLVVTRRMQGVRVDPMARTARVDAGVRWERVLHEAAAFGLAPLAGSSPDVGAVGYTVGGGLGLLGRLHGYAADHVTSIDVVSGNGSLRTATAGQYPDLFWGVRGGKGSLGVVTSMDIGLFPVPRFYGGGLFFRGSTAGTVLHAYRRWVRDVPEGMSSSVALNRFPLSEDVPEALRGRFTVHVRIAYCGSAEDGEALVRPLRSAAVPLSDTVAEMPFRECGRIHADPPLRSDVVERNALLRELDEDAVDALLDVVGPDSASPLSFLEVRHLGGALARPPAVPNAVGHRGAGFLLYSATPPDRDGAVLAHSALLAERMAPWAAGTALNFLGTDDESRERMPAAYEPRDLQRLRQLQRTYDPHGLFRADRPAVAAGPG